jgi:hypothetical protein
MVSRLLDIIIPGRWRRRHTARIYSMMEPYLDAKKLEEMVQKEDSLRSRIANPSPDISAKSRAHDFCNDPKA